MKRVSFKVAKYLKEVGYPQDSLKDNIYVSEPNAPFSEVAYQPTYLEVWLWLWREKHIAVEADYSCANNDWFDGGICGKKFNDPEEAIIAAIEYIVTNKLIK